MLAADTLVRRGSATASFASPAGRRPAPSDPARDRARPGRRRRPRAAERAAPGARRGGGPARRASRPRCGSAAARPPTSSGSSFVPSRATRTNRAARSRASVTYGRVARDPVAATRVEAQAPRARPAVKGKRRRRRCLQVAAPPARRAQADGALQVMARPDVVQVDRPVAPNFATVKRTRSFCGSPLEGEKSALNATCSARRRPPRPGRRRRAASITTDEDGTAECREGRWVPVTPPVVAAQVARAHVGADEVVADDLLRAGRRVGDGRGRLLDRAAPQVHRCDY